MCAKLQRTSFEAISCMRVSNNWSLTSDEVLRKTQNKFTAITRVSVLTYIFVKESRKSEVQSQ